MTATGLVTGLLVGLTGMGGGALTMPLLTLVFGVPPLAAVSTDLVANAVTKPAGALVHLGRRTVDLRLVGWLCAGSLPCAAVGSVLSGYLGERSQDVLKIAAAVAVVLAAVTLFVRMYLDRVRVPALSPTRPGALPTVLLGALAGLVVGTTSVGSGSIVIVCLLLLHRRLTSSELVGTDLVQAVPLVLVAAVAHLLVGEVDFALVGALLAGSIPGVLAGALLSARTPDAPIRVLLGAMLTLTGLVLLSVPVAVALVPAVAVAAAAGAGLAVRPRPPVGVGNEGEPR
ncbi:sulfite exporter TauE/SafE family protein [Saccharopolyspora taberi]|uniref:sulfite exporter TauE/SafE family protein n=1 Tax=Saccharopolyspora taberi TaxID=60895 RepID=UPI0031CF086F